MRSAPLSCDFNHHEVVDYFEHAVNANLSETALLQLEEITEGWVAGLSLAAISLAEGSDPQDLISRLSSSDRRVSDYLLDQVLSDQPIGVQSFLLKISLLDRFCAPLCQAMIGIEGVDGQAQTFWTRSSVRSYFSFPWTIDIIGFVTTPCSRECSTSA